MKAIIVSILTLVTVNLWAGQCPDLTGSFKCLIASDTMDIESKAKDGVWHYSGDQINVFGDIIADGVERNEPGYENIEGSVYRYKAYCEDNKLILLTKALYEDGKGFSDIEGPTEYGSRAVYYLKGNRIKTKGVFYDEYPQRHPTDINWERDIVGRKVERDFNLSCKRVRSQ